MRSKSPSAAPAGRATAPDWRTGPGRRLGPWLGPRLGPCLVGTAGRATLAVVLLLVVTTLAHSPAFRAQFISLDDLTRVPENPNLRDLAGLARIWNPAEARCPHMYQPLTFGSWWVEYQLFGPKPLVYHAVNVVLHLINVLLVLALARALGLPFVAAFGVAAAFAVHPVQVPSVVWVAERKNVLSAMFYLGALLAYLDHRRTRRWRGGPYVLCLALYASALLAKTQDLGFPVSLLLADWALQKSGKLPRARLDAIAFRLLPLVVLSVLAAAITIHIESRVDVPRFTLVERLLLVSNAAWFYVRDLLAPLRQSPIYTRWQLSATDPLFWIAPVGWALVAGLVWRLRRRLAPLPTWGVLQFFIILAPILGFVSWGYLEFSFVADHYLYLAIPGAGVAVACGLMRAGPCLQALARRRGERGAGLMRKVGGPALGRAAAAAGVLVILGWSALSYREASHWTDSHRFWEYTVSRNPGGFLPNFAYGKQLADENDIAHADVYLERAHRMRPDYAPTFRLYLGVHRQVYGEESALAECNALLATYPGHFAGRMERAISLERLGRLDAARADLQWIASNAPRGSDVLAEAGTLFSRIEARATPSASLPPADAPRPTDGVIGRDSRPHR